MRDALVLILVGLGGCAISQKVDEVASGSEFVPVEPSTEAQELEAFGTLAEGESVYSVATACLPKLSDGSFLFAYNPEQCLSNPDDPDDPGPEITPLTCNNKAGTFTCTGLTETFITSVVVDMSTSVVITRAPTECDFEVLQVLEPENTGACP